MQMFRDLYIAQNSGSSEFALLLDDDSAQRLKHLSQRISSGSLLKCLEIFSTLENDLRYATRPEIWLELAIGKACRIQKEQSYEALLERVETLEKKLANGIAPKSCARCGSPKLSMISRRNFTLSRIRILPRAKNRINPKMHRMRPLMTGRRTHIMARATDIRRTPRSMVCPKTIAMSRHATAALIRRRRHRKPRVRLPKKRRSRQRKRRRQKPPKHRPTCPR